MSRKDTEITQIMDFKMTINSVLKTKQTNKKTINVGKNVNKSAPFYDTCENVKFNQPL